MTNVSHEQPVLDFSTYAGAAKGMSFLALYVVADVLAFWRLRQATCAFATDSRPAWADYEKTCFVLQPEANFTFVSGLRLSVAVHPYLLEKLGWPPY